MDYNDIGSEPEKLYETRERSSVMEIEDKEKGTKKLNFRRKKAFTNTRSRFFRVPFYEKSLLF